MTQPVFKRETFTTSRLMEFFNEKELSMQIGYDKVAWPIALVKELIDNSLDACENAKITPAINVRVGQDWVTVGDNGPGLPLSTLEKSLDYSIRVSDKNGYVAPTRGQLGNALKCVWAAPFVANRLDHACVEVDTPEGSRTISVSLDRIAQEPRLAIIENDRFVINGTFVKMHWPEIASYLNSITTVYFTKRPITVDELIRRYSLFNPHATFELCNRGENTKHLASVEDISKWTPSTATSPHWYSFEQLRLLVAAYINKDRQVGRRTTIREFVSTFNGLSGTAKQKTVTSSFGHSAYLDEMIDGKGDIDQGKIEAVLCAMKAESREIKPEALGCIGKEHMVSKLKSAYFCVEDMLEYRIKRGVVNGRPYVLEVGFGNLIEDYEGCGRQVLTGLNFTPTLTNPINHLDMLLGQNRCDSDDPIVIAVHLSYPAIEFTDRGKSRTALPTAIIDDLTTMIESVTKNHKRLKNEHAKQAKLSQRQIQEDWKRRRASVMSIKDACYQIMVEAYMKVSDNNALPANARQIMYAARPLVLALAGKFFSTTNQFTQGILPDFQRDNPELTDNWDVVYDDRGHLIEPHTNRTIGMGTIAVRRYIKNWTDGNIKPIEDSPTLTMDNHIDLIGPKNLYSAVLFVEKEGFNELFAKSEIANKFDIAIISTKGQTVTAARKLAEEFTKIGVPIYVLHDFDKSGVEILNAYRTDTRRYQFSEKPLIHEIGLRLEDALAMGLESEEVNYPAGIDPRVNLRRCGATDDECNFLVKGGNEETGWHGRRVELNAMTSRQFIQFIEEKLNNNGVGKVVPDVKTIGIHYKNTYLIAMLQRKLDDIFDQLTEDEQAIKLPDDLESIIREAISANKSVPWHKTVEGIAEEQARKALLES